MIVGKINPFKNYSIFFKTTISHQLYKYLYNELKPRKTFVLYRCPDIIHSVWDKSILGCAIPSLWFDGRIPLPDFCAGLALSRCCIYVTQISAGSRRCTWGCPQFSGDPKGWEGKGGGYHKHALLCSAAPDQLLQSVSWLSLSAFINL